MAIKIRWYRHVDDQPDGGAKVREPAAEEAVRRDEYSKFDTPCNALTTVYAPQMSNMGAFYTMPPPHPLKHIL